MFQAFFDPKVYGPLHGLDSGEKITFSFKIRGHSSARHALSAKFLFSGQTCTAAGWGLVSEKGLASEELKEVRKTSIESYNQTKKISKN